MNTIDDMKIELIDAEESAIRALRERDEAMAECERWKQIADAANARNPETVRLRNMIFELKEHVRIGDIANQNYRIELRLLKHKIRLLNRMLGEKKQ